MQNIINQILSSILLKGPHVTIRVVEWVNKPLKKIVDNACYQRYRKELCSFTVFKESSKNTKKRIIKSINRAILTKGYIKFTLEESTVGKKRTPATWDSYWLEQEYAQQLRVKLPLATPKKLTLTNKGRCYFKYMHEVEFPTYIAEKTSKQEGLEKLKDGAKYLVEPCYALIKRSKAFQQKMPKFYVSLWQKREKKGYDCIFKQEFIPEEADERISRTKFDLELGQNVEIRGKTPDTHINEGVYDFDGELRPQKYFFSDWAKELVEADHRYNGDLAQAIKDIKDYYYSRPEVVEYLKGYYTSKIHEHTDEYVVSFEKFVETIKSYNEPLIEKYPLEDVLEGFSASPQNNKEANYA